ELKKMSDSSRAPVESSTRKLVDAKTRSSAGSFRNPGVETPSSSPGILDVKPTNWYAIDAGGTACQSANAVAGAVWKSAAVPPGARWLLTKYRTGVAFHFSVT